jgi:thymidylate synthase (FAD)
MTQTDLIPLNKLEPGYAIPVLGQGYVRYIDHLGTDQRIVETARISYKSPSKGEEADKKLLFYLFKNRHTSPFESCNITFNIKMPIFCMRQFVRHRTIRLNEWSGRYSELADEFYVPEKWRKQDTKNKQGSIEVDENSDMFKLWNDANTAIATKNFQQSYADYQQLLKNGVAKELARVVLPVSLFTEVYANIDVHNLIHFLNLRLDPHAQWEMREIAKGMESIFKELYPWCYEAFTKYKFTLKEITI